MPEQDRASQALDILDDYFLARLKYTRQLRNQEPGKSKAFRKVERDYLKVEQEVLELMGADT